MLKSFTIVLVFVTFGLNSFAGTIVSGFSNDDYVIRVTELKDQTIKFELCQFKQRTNCRLLGDRAFTKAEIASKHLKKKWKVLPVAAVDGVMLAAAFGVAYFATIIEAGLVLAAAGEGTALATTAVVLPVGVEEASIIAAGITGIGLHVGLAGWWISNFRSENVNVLKTYEVIGFYNPALAQSGEFKVSSERTLYIAAMIENDLLSLGR